MNEHLPALQTVVPMMAAPICILLRRASWVRVFAVAVAWSCLAIALALLEQVLTHGTISYALGGWAAPLGIEYRVDVLNAYVLVIVATIGAVVIPFPLDGRELRIPRERYYLFYSLFLLCLAGLLGITITGDLFNIFVFLEISSLSAYALIGLGRDRGALTVAYYVLVRVIFGIFGAAFFFETIGLSSLLLPLSLAAMVVGSLAAIQQTNIKRLLAYSSIAQIGYMTLGLSLANLNGLTGGLVHLFNHALMKGGLFLVVACALSRVASPDLEALRGLGRKMPLTMAAFVVGGLSLIGVPGTVGFVSKWFLVLGALDKGLYLVAFFILASSLLAVVYVWRVVEIMYFRESAVPVERDEAPLSMLVPTWILIGGTVYFGLNTELTAGVAHTAAQFLLGGAS